MKDVRQVVNENVVPLKAPVDSAGTAFATPWVDLKNALHATFFDYFGVVTATSADQNIVVTMEAATAATSNAEVAIAFKYRLSAATGNNTWGAVTAVAATGLSLDTTSSDGMMLMIDIDPAALEAQLADARFVRLVQGIDAGAPERVGMGPEHTLGSRGGARGELHAEGRHRILRACRQDDRVGVEPREAVLEGRAPLGGRIAVVGLGHGQPAQVRAVRGHQGPQARLRDARDGAAVARVPV